MIYFTSDLHLGHNAVIRMCERPFENAEEMNKVLTNNTNARAHKNDTLSHCQNCCSQLGHENGPEGR